MMNRRKFKLLFVNGGGNLVDWNDGNWRIIGINQS